MSFDHLGLSDDLLKAVADSGYTDPTPIQAQTIPSVLMGKDILGIAQTGTGKTASFVLPMLDILGEGRARARMPRSLILEPTRELAAQVAESFEKYGKNHKLTKALLIGGVNFGDQEKLLDRGVDVLIATPGRLLDHFQRGKLLLTNIDILVVDEADRMLDMGFIPDVEKICQCITGRHQTLFFSATMPPPIKKLTDQFLSEPKFIEVARTSSVASTVKQHLVSVDPKKKRAVLRHLIAQEDIKNGIIFCNRKVDVKETYASLKRDKYNVGQLHGDMQQSERTEILAGFKSGEIKLLCASDVAARGLDIPDVSHVFNFDVPSHAEDYVHRIGRTGRAGREGSAFTFTTSRRDDTKYVAAIEKMIQDKLPVVDLKDFGGKPASKAKAAQKSQEKEAPKKLAQEKPGQEQPESGQKHAKTGPEPQNPEPKSSEPKNDTSGQKAPSGQNNQVAKPNQNNRRSGRNDVVDIGSFPDDQVRGMGHHVPEFMVRPLAEK